MGATDRRERGGGRRGRGSVPACIGRRSERLIALFRRYAKRYVSRSFHAVRLSRGGAVPGLAGGPSIVVLNHPSWWDPLVGMVLSELWPGREHYVPIDAGALRRYRLFERLGFYGVDPGSAAGIRAFLETSVAIAARPNAMIWITAQGRFADPRERPLVLRPGVGHLLRRLETGWVLPLALEYPFWSERGPEALARLGRPFAIEEGRGRTAGQWTGLIAEALAKTQDDLAVEAVGRDPSAFEVLLRGGAGVGGVYDLWRRFRAAIRGERFRPEHDPRRSVPRE